jgi:phosphopantothenoylcysteine decarboxylase/phosphopantothenate--cysteine ligase
MFNNPMVRQNVKKLKNAGYHFTGPVRGMLACGREGIGHIAPVEEIASEAEEILKKSRE